MLKIHDLTEIEELEKEAMETVSGGRSLYWYSDTKQSTWEGVNTHKNWLTFEQNVLNLQ